MVREEGGEGSNLNTELKWAEYDLIWNCFRSFIVTTSSRQNLDSIVEAIRHLEGDHLFSEEQQVSVL